MGKTRGGGSWQKEGPQSPPGFLSLPSIFISSLFPEIRMSKPLEAEKQSLDSPSEHTGEGGRAEAGKWAGVQKRLATCPFFPFTDTERNGPDINHQVRMTQMR